MSEDVQAVAEQSHAIPVRKPDAAAPAPELAAEPLAPSAILQRAALAPQSLRSADIQRLQQTLGNRATGALLRQLVAPARPLVQAKLTVNTPGDAFEQEADRIAEAVMRMPAVRGQEAVAGEKPSVMTRPQPPPAAGGAFEADEAFEQQLRAARGQGQPLPPALRVEFEAKFGADFGGVRVHADARSDRLNRSIEAQAFTSGQDVFFRQGAFNPGSQGDQGLVAHELTHVLQQNRNLLQAPASTRMGGLSDSAGNRIQRMMVRMPNPYEEEGARRFLGDAEIEEMGQALRRSGRGKGGDFEWEDEKWRFAQGEVNYFYGHGNRSAIGGVSAEQFVDEAIKPNRNMLTQTAIKLLACGGGQKEVEGEAYGAQVSKELQSRNKQWQGSLQATEGFLYYTEDYKVITGDHPRAATRGLRSAQESDEDFVKELFNYIVEKTKSFGNFEALRISLREVLQVWNTEEAKAKGFNANTFLAQSNVSVGSESKKPSEQTIRTYLRQWLKGLTTNQKLTVLRYPSAKASMENSAYLGEVTGKARDLYASMTGPEGEAKGKEIWGTMRQEIGKDTGSPKSTIGTIEKGEDQKRRFKTFQDFGPTRKQTIKKSWHKLPPPPPPLAIDDLPPLPLPPPPPPISPDLLTDEDA